jgi:hypothetical protein
MYVIFIIYTILIRTDVFALFLVLLLFIYVYIYLLFKIDSILIRNPHLFILLTKFNKNRIIFDLIERKIVIFLCLFLEYVNFKENFCSQIDQVFNQF